MKILSNKNFRIPHIYREGNRVADAMVEIALSISDFTWWYGVLGATEIAYNRNLSSKIEIRVVH